LPNRAPRSIIGVRKRMMEMEMTDTPQPPTEEMLERWFDRFGSDRPDLPPVQAH
jgi:hypothetical protein